VKRDLERLSGQEFDLLVVGSGIYGAAITRTAALQGLKVALIDRGDFGGATSANSQKVIHGGLRYLQHFDFRRMRESILARRSLLRLAPHLVRPLQVVIPTHGYGLRSRPAMASALMLNDLISWDRNRGPGLQRTLPQGRTVSKEQCLAWIPGLSPKNVTGAAVWYDAIALNTERLVLSFVLSAADHGACVANYVSATGYLRSGDAIAGVTAEDHGTHEKFDIRAKLVVNAMGPWANSISPSPDQSTGRLPDHWAQAINIVINRRLFGDRAVGLSAGDYIDKDAILKKGSRDYFFVPWRQGTIIGTAYDRYLGPADDSQIRPEAVLNMIRNINRTYPAAELEPTDVCFVHAGLLPEKKDSRESGADIQLQKWPVMLRPDRSGGVPGLLSVVGVKYTTGPTVAVEVVKDVLRRIGRDWVDISAVPLCAGVSGTAAGRIRKSETRMAPEVTDYLKAQYGERHTEVLSHREMPAPDQRISAAEPVVAAQVVHAIREEMAESLTDVVFRRTELGSFSFPGRDALLACAQLMARECGWSEQRMLSELEAVELAYAPLAEAGCISLPTEKWI
jgi:glycerol-3-phosphate dehydrogenase